MYVLSPLTVELRTDTVSTGIAGRDIELRGEAFFDAGKFPHASFSSTKIAARANETFALQGTLTIHGVARSIETSTRLLKQRSEEGWVIALKTTFDIDRDNFGISWRHPVESFVGDQVRKPGMLQPRLITTTNDSAVAAEVSDECEPTVLPVHAVHREGLQDRVGACQGPLSSSHSGRDASPAGRRHHQCAARSLAW